MIKKSGQDYYPQENQQQEIDSEFNWQKRYDSDLVNPKSETESSYQSEQNTQSRASNMNDEEYFKRIGGGTANFGNDCFNPFNQDNYHEASKNR